MPLSFLSFPAELRLQIYAYVYDDSQQNQDIWIKLCSKNNEKSKYVDVSRKVSSLLRGGISLNRTCQAIHEETRSQCTHLTTSAKHQFCLRNPGDIKVFIAFRRAITGEAATERGKALIKLPRPPFSITFLRLRFDLAKSQYWTVLCNMRRYFADLETLQLEIRTMRNLRNPNRPAQLYALDTLMNSLDKAACDDGFVEFRMWLVDDLSLDRATRVLAGDEWIWIVTFKRMREVARCLKNWKFEGDDQEAHWTWSYGRK